MTESSGFIPQSSALSEAKTDSLGELLSRNPFDLTPEDRKKTVAALREQRARWELAEAAGKAPKVARSAKSLETTKSAGELDL